MLVSLGIDDVVDASPVHGFCGAYGVIMVGLLATESNYAAAYYSDRADDCAGIFYGGNGKMLAANIVFVIAIFLWVTLTSLLVFGPLKLLGLLRVHPSVEELGMDSSEHGAKHYAETDSTGLDPSG